MKKLLIYPNNNPQSLAIEVELREKLLAVTCQIVDSPFDRPDYIVTIGGDGTLLSAFHEFQDCLDKVQFIGIHTGHLGFYTDWLPDELDELVKGIGNNDGKSTSYPLLRVTIRQTNQEEVSYLALNELSLRTFPSTMVCDIYVKDQFFETFRGDGLCVATPTGSTGLNKSLGGAIIHPRLDAIQMTEMASLNNRVFRSLSSPMVIPRDEWFTVRPEVNSREALLMVDHLKIEGLIVEEIHLELAEERLHFASFRHTHFWDRVEESFIGNK